MTIPCLVHKDGGWYVIHFIFHLYNMKSFVCIHIPTLKQLIDEIRMITQEPSIFRLFITVPDIPCFRARCWSDNSKQFLIAQANTLPNQIVITKEPMSREWLIRVYYSYELFVVFSCFGGPRMVHKCVFSWSRIARYLGPQMRIFIVR